VRQTDGGARNGGMKAENAQRERRVKSRIDRYRGAERRTEKAAQPYRTELE